MTFDNYLSSRKNLKSHDFWVKRSPEKEKHFGHHFSKKQSAQVMSEGGGWWVGEMLEDERQKIRSEIKVEI